MTNILLSVGWYNAAQVLFTVGLVMLFLAAVAQTAFACCHCGLKRAWVPTLVASLTLVAGTLQDIVFRCIGLLIVDLLIYPTRS